MFILFKYIKMLNYFRDPKRQSAPAHVPVAPLAVPEVTPAPVTPEEEKPQIQKDADSDFAELNPLDDVDVSDQLIRKKPVSGF